MDISFVADEVGIGWLPVSKAGSLLTRAKGARIVDVVRLAYSYDANLDERLERQGADFPREFFIIRSPGLVGLLLENFGYLLFYFSDAYRLLTVSRVPDLNQLPPIPRRQYGIGWMIISAVEKPEFAHPLIQAQIGRTVRAFHTLRSSAEARGYGEFRGIIGVEVELDDLSSIVIAEGLELERNWMLPVDAGLHIFSGSNLNKDHLEEKIALTESDF